MKKQKKDEKEYARIGLIILLAAIDFFPIYWILVAAFKTPDRLLSRSLSGLLPIGITLENFKNVLTNSSFPTYFFNSVIVALIVTVVSLIISSFGGYSLARLKFKSRNTLGRVILFTYMVPSVLLVVPMFGLIVTFNLYNTYAALVIAHLTFSLPFSLWMMRGFFASLPHELEEAAMVDGATRVGALIRIVFPLAAPGMVATAMFSFLQSWNEYLFALVLVTDDSIRTLPVGVMASFVSTNMEAYHWANLMAASAMSSIPVFLLFVFLQKYLIQGMASGAVKG